MLNAEYDVVIVGAGPAGAGAARALAGHGLSGVIVDKATPPRYKMCSGILFPSAVKTITTTFGELPERVRCAPARIRGCRAFLDLDGPALDAPFSLFEDDPEFGEDGLNADRAALDHWLCLQGDAPIVGDCLFKGVRQDGDEMVVELRHDGHDLAIRTRYLIGADGTRSTVRQSSAGDFEQGVRLIPNYEEWYTGTIDLEAGWLYMFFDRSITGYFATVFHKDGRIIAVTGARRDEPVRELFSRFRCHLEEKHGLQIEEKVAQSGCSVHDMSATGHYYLGDGNVVLAGEAGGFNRCGEGITSALVSGRVAGEAVLASLDSGRPAVEYYADAVAPEIEVCTKVNRTIEAMVGLNPFTRDDAGVESVGGVRMGMP